MLRSEYDVFMSERLKVRNWLPEYLKTLPEVPVKGGTLLYGYDASRETVHLYLEPGGQEAVKVAYDHMKRIKYALRQSVSGDVQELLSLKGLLPTKRLYPAACSLSFCQFLRDHRVDPNFTIFDDRPVPESGFYGLVLPPMTADFPNLVVEKTA